jgi:hypothetical protein
LTRIIFFKCSYSNAISRQIYFKNTTKALFHSPVNEVNAAIQGEDGGLKLDATVKGNGCLLNFS